MVRFAQMECQVLFPEPMEGLPVLKYTQEHAQGHVSKDTFGDVHFISSALHPRMYL